MSERRTKQERRRLEVNFERCGKHNRRVSPDRRLNNIAAVWIPINHIYVHPLTRDVFGKQ